MTIALEPLMVPPELEGPQPVETYLRVALAQNREVQSAWFDVQAMKERIPQVTSLDDPMVLNTIYPFPSNAPQYSLMGYGPYDAMITQQFPWFGVLRLRGEVAEQEVNAALSALATAQLDVIEQVKRSYATLFYNQRAERILEANRELAEDFVEIATIRYQTGATSQQDVLRAENAIVEVDAELAEVRRGLAEAQAALARQLHVSPEMPLQALAELPEAEMGRNIESLFELAASARPELHGQLAEVARSSREVELARKRYSPELTLGVSYMMMTRSNAMSDMADGRDNVGMVVGFNMPIYREKLHAGVREAVSRSFAEARRYEALRDETYESVAELFAEVKARREVLELIRDSFFPRSQQALEVAISDYQSGSLDFVSLITAWREVLQVELRIAQIEADLSRAIASLERVVGVQLRENPPISSFSHASPEGWEVDEPPGPPPASEGSPFRQAPGESNPLLGP